MSPTENPKLPQRSGRALIAMAGLLALGVLLWQTPFARWLDAAQSWQETRPLLAALVYVLFVALGTPLMVPGSVLMMTGGFLFGGLAGFFLAAIGITLGATIACVLGRRVARDTVLRALGDRPIFAGLEQALKARGFLVVLLTRLSLIIPFNALNYAFSVSSVSLSRYVPATALGMLPSVGLFTYAGSLAGDVESLLAGDATGGTSGSLVLVGGLIAVVLATIVIHRTATAELRKHLAASESSRQIR